EGRWAGRAGRRRGVGGRLAGPALGLPGGRGLGRGGAAAARGLRRGTVACRRLPLAGGGRLLRAGRILGLRGGALTLVGLGSLGAGGLGLAGLGRAGLTLPGLGLAGLRLAGLGLAGLALPGGLGRTARAGSGRAGR